MIASLQLKIIAIYCTDDNVSREQAKLWGYRCSRACTEEVTRNQARIAVR